MESLLQPSINLGLSERDFWEMTLLEVERFMEGAVYQLKLKAQFDYSLAHLIGVSMARCMDDKVEFPAIEDVYPAIFEQEAKEREAQAAVNNSINNFLSFAMAHNNAMIKKGVENNKL